MSLIDKIFGRNRNGKDSSEQLDSLMSVEETDREEPVFRDEEVGLAHILRVFERYTANKTDFLYEQLPQRKKIVFDLVPFLVHVEAKDLLGCPDDCQMSPHGVYGYKMRSEVPESFVEAFPDQKLPRLPSRVNFDPNLPIKSICLIGSMGSIAQNSKSDFDYWICVDRESFSRETFLYFKEKLRAIDSWAEEFAGAEVHCFPLDLNKVRVDDFGSAGGESSGTAQGRLLKEEFYRSMTLVAGQVPLWWIMPLGVSDEEYNRLAEVVKHSNRINMSDLVDMGNVHGISLGEFYGAAIWQINKTIGSPFKSVLKMALLEEYMFSRGGKGLLCDELKQRLLTNEEEIQLLDTYVLMFDRASEFLTQKSRFDDLELLRRSLYLKSGAKLALADHRRTDLPRKGHVLVNLIRNWGWQHKAVEHLNNYHLWSFRESQEFSQEINRFIIKAYKSVSDELNKQEEQSDLKITKRDLTVLGRKLFIFYSKRTNKVESIKSVIEAPPSLNSLTIQPHINGSGSKVWAAYRGLLSKERVAGGEAASLLMRRSPYLPEVLIWLVTNRLYDAGTSVNLNTAPGKPATYCTIPDIQTLLQEMADFFPAYKLSELKEEEMLEKPHIVRMLLVINMDEPDQTTKIVQTSVCYQNNWGEVFFKGYVNSEEGLKIARNFMRKRFAFDPLEALSRVKIFMPDRLFKRDLRPRLNKFFGLKISG